METMKRVTVHCLASSLHCCQHYVNPCRNWHKTGQNFQHICKGNDDDVLRLCYGNYGNNKFVGNCQGNSSLHRFHALIFIFVEVLRKWRQILEAIRQWNVNYGKKLKQWSDEAFNAGKEIEAMKGLTLYGIASSLLLPSFARYHSFLRIRILYANIYIYIYIYI